MTKSKATLGVISLCFGIALLTWKLVPAFNAPVSSPSSSETTINDSLDDGTKVLLRLRQIASNIVRSEQRIGSLNADLQSAKVRVPPIKDVIEKIQRTLAEMEADLAQQVAELVSLKKRREQIFGKNAFARDLPSAATPLADPKAEEVKLTLDPTASKRIQIALRDQGSDPGDIDGMLGPQSRNAIIAWQKSRNEPPTGYLSAPQYKSLLEASQAAIAKFERNTQQ